MSAPVLPPDLSRLTDLVVARLEAAPDLAPLTVTDPDGTVHHSIVGRSNNDLYSSIAAAVARLNVAVVVMIERAIPTQYQGSAKYLYDPVELLIEVQELVELNATSPASEPPGTGTGLPAWTIADRIFAALTDWPVPMAKPWKLYARPPGIIDATSVKDAEDGYKIVRLHFQTKIEGVPRAF